MRVVVVAMIVRMSALSWNIAVVTAVESAFAKVASPPDPKG